MPPQNRSSRRPPPVTEGSTVLVSHIPLPPLPSIAYAKFIPLQQQEQHHRVVELARQYIVNDVRRKGRSILESLLPIVCIGTTETVLWVFSVGSEENCAQTKEKRKEKEPISVWGELEALAFDGLQRRDISHFTPSTIYPCSPECAKISTPCPSCSRIPSTLSTPSSSSATLFPRLPLRPIYTLFIDAVRDRLIDDICTIYQRPTEDNVRVYVQAPKRTSSATRFGHGFLSGGDDSSPLWGFGWERRSHNRPLVHTALDIYLSPTALHIRPLPTLTTLLPVPNLCSPSFSPASSDSIASLNSPPLSPGTPLMLAPYPTPAFYVSTLPGTSVSHSLRAQFCDALTGLGASSIPPRHRPCSLPSTSFLPINKCSCPTGCTSHTTVEPFVLAFIPLHNPQGEPKGVSTLWPAHLAFIDTNPNRFHLTNLPEMPGTETLLTPPRGSGAQPPNLTCSGSILPQSRWRPSVRRSFDRLIRTQRVFRASELSSHKRIPGVPIHSTAKNAAGYVESVARERERERERANQERMRRERETKEGKASSSGAPVPSNPSSSVPQVAQSSGSSGDPSEADSSSPNIIADVIRSEPHWHSPATIFFTKAAQDSVVHSFYPSPPDWNPLSTQNSGTSEPTSGIVATVTSTSSSTGIPHMSRSQPDSCSAQQTIRDTLDLSNSIHLGMDIDINDMSMDINLRDTMNMMSANIGVNMDGTGLMDGAFGSFTDAFTDDDFNYFDTVPASETITVVAPNIQPPLHHLGNNQGAMDEWLAEGLAGPSEGGNVAIASQMQPVTSTFVGIDAPTHDSSLARTMDTVTGDDRELVPLAPDLIPSSPAKSPWSPGDPQTPSLDLNMPSIFKTGKGMFEPIYFGDRHYVADGKYRDTTGKFAFPNTLPRTSFLSDTAPDNPDASSNEREEGWKLQYDAITDPRVGVVNRLRGIKRKFYDNPYSKSVKVRLRHEEWESLYDQHQNTEVLESPSSSDEEDTIDAPEMEQDCDDDSSFESHPSRPTTPTPTDLPLSATLLYFHLRHAHMLPLGVPMRPSYSDLVPINDPPLATISVPTPVSPAAALGSAAERNKTLELLAQAVAKEAVENGVWAQAWGSVLDNPFSARAPRTRHEISQTDLKVIVDLMGKVVGLKGPSPLSVFLDPSSSLVATHYPSISAHERPLQMLQLPRFSIGRAGLVHHMLPSVLRFWEKEGLGPRGGTKDVVAFALFEEGDERSTLVEAWMGRVGRAYNARGFGNHISGNAGTFERGLVPLQFEAVRKILSMLLTALPPEPQHIVIYIIAPPSVCSSLKSPALRAIIMGHRRVSKLGGQHDFDQDRVLVHFVPDYYITDPYIYPTTRHVGLERFVISVYDRLLRVTMRQTSRRFWEYNPPFENRFQVPAFTLARGAPPQARLEWDEHPSLNVLDRHTFLHVGYRLSECKKWLLAACIDERGEAHDVAVWGVPNQNDLQALNVNWMVSNIWIFIKQFAQRAHTEWRIIIAKFGEMRENEVEVWASHLETMVSAHTGPPVYVGLVCAHNDIPLPFLSPADASGDIHPAVVTDVSSVFADVSSVTYSAFFPHRTPIISLGLLCPSEYPSLVTPVSPTEDEEKADSIPLTRSSVGILPLCTTALLRVPNDTDYARVETLYIHLLYAYESAKSTLKKTTHEVHAEITRNWHDLAVLTKERWHFPQQGQLPFHLAALEMMSDVLDPDVLTPDTREVEYL